MAQLIRGGINGWAARVCGAVWDRGAVYRTFGRTSLARRLRLCRVRWASGVTLKTRPRVYECATCHRQESVTAGTVFHRTRTDLTKWFLAAYLMGRDKRGVSAKFLHRTAYQSKPPAEAAG